MPNNVLLNNHGVIEQTYEGDQSEESISVAIRNVLPLIHGLRKKNRPVCILTDLSNLGKSSAGSRKASVDALKEMDYDRIALFGANPFMKSLANLIITASGQGEKVKMFNTREDAEQWLMKP